MVHLATLVLACVLCVFVHISELNEVTHYWSYCLIIQARALSRAAMDQKLGQIAGFPVSTGPDIQQSSRISESAGSWPDRISGRVFLHATFFLLFTLSFIFSFLNSFLLHSGDQHSSNGKHLHCDSTVEMLTSGLLPSSFL